MQKMVRKTLVWSECNFRLPQHLDTRAFVSGWIVGVQPNQLAPDALVTAAHSMGALVCT